MGNVLNVNEAELLEFSGGVMNSLTAQAFDSPGKISVQSLRLAPGAVREPHVHPNAEQVHVCIEGSARIGVIGPRGDSRTDELRAGDSSNVPQGLPHWVENTGDTELRVLVVLGDPDPQTVDLSEILAAVPNDALARALEVPQEAVEGLPSGRVGIGAGSG